jgi:DEAD/DEAH box helicase domain-containing protein
VVSTNALELGVDIGDLSVCILSGYPGTIASTWQQAGRAGRRQDASATVLVGGPSPLDQYLLTHPQYLLGHTPEAALIAPDNPFVLRSHLECAAFEYPFREGEGFSPAVDTSAALAEIGAQDDVLHRSGKRWYWMSSRYPAQDVSLRTAGNERFSIVSADSGETVGEVDSSSAPQLVHPGAVYLHEGATYLVEELDWPARVASVRHVDADYFTQASVSAKVQVLQVRDSLAGLPASRGWGDVQVNTRATGYSRLAWFSHEKLETLPLDLPELELITTAYWLHLGAEIVTALQDQGDWTIAALRSYGPNWAEQRRKARQRDRFRCRNCGRPETSERQLDVHHLSPFRTFDYRPGQNDNYIQANHLDNLVSLCHDCHRRLETAREMLGTLEGMANLLKSIAPLFLMCDSRDLGVVADLDMGFTGGPTVVLYDAVPGGVGFSEALFGLHDTILGTCRDWVDKCACQEGCPACVGAPVETGLGAKRRVRTLLDALVG